MALDAGVRRRATRFVHWTALRDKGVQNDIFPGMCLGGCSDNRGECIS